MSENKCLFCSKTYIGEGFLGWVEHLKVCRARIPKDDGVRVVYLPSTLIECPACGTVGWKKEELIDDKCPHCRS